MKTLPEINCGRVKLPSPANGIRICTTTAVAVIFAITSSYSANLITAQDSTASGQQLQQLNSAIDKIEQWINIAQGNRSDLQNQLQELDTRIGSISEDIRINLKQITVQEEKLQQLSRSTGLLEKEITSQQDLVQDAVRLSYMTGRQSFLKVLLNQEDVARATRMLRYYDYFNKARVAQIAQFNTTLNQLRTTQRETDTARGNLQTSNIHLQQQKASLRSNKNSRSELLLDLNNAIDNKNNELETLIDDREHLQQLLLQISNAVAGVPRPSDHIPFPELKGLLPWPGDGTLVARFGANYEIGNLRRKGIIIAAEEGSAVRAVHSGRVVFANWLKGSGLLIILDHSDGYMSVYAHNQTLLKHSGDWVGGGEIISTTGSSGGQDSAGIYFEIRQNGVASNPLDWFSSRK